MPPPAPVRRRPVPGLRVSGALLALLAVSACTAGTRDGIVAPTPRTSAPPSARAGDTVPVPPDAQAAAVRSVLDGDTVVLIGSGPGPLRAGRQTKVRLLEVDTPEVGGGQECFGPQASAYVRRLLPRDARVRVSQDRDLLDRYDRTLLYVWLADGRFLNELLVAEGYARAVLFRPNDRYIERLRAAEQEARRNRRGLWAACPQH